MLYIYLYIRERILPNSIVASRGLFVVITLITELCIQLLPPHIYPLSRYDGRIDAKLLAHCTIDIFYQLYFLSALCWILDQKLLNSIFHNLNLLFLFIKIYVVYFIYFYI